MKQAFGLIALISVVIILAVVFASQANYRSASAAYCYQGNVTPIFSPDNSEIIFNLIGNAKHDIKLEVYEFSYKTLANALIDSKERGVSVKVILEPSVSQNNGMLNYLINNGIDAVWASKKFHNTHSKFMIVDGSIVLVGSINWSENALKNNREAAVIVYSREVAQDFEKIFDSDFSS